MILLGTLEGQRVTFVRRFAAHRSDLELLPSVILAGAVGNFLGFQAWFLVGRRFGRPLLERRPHWARRIANVQDWLGRYETIMSISRSASRRAWIASAPWRSGCPKFSVQWFTVLNALGALLWAATLAVAGYLLGKPPGAGSGEPAAIAKALLIGTVVLTVAWIVYHELSDRRSRHAAGAKI